MTKMKWTKATMAAVMATTLLAGCAGTQGTSKQPAAAPKEPAKTAEPAKPVEPAPKKDPVEITFFFPVAVGGPITKIMDQLGEEFNKAHPDIRVKPVYTGSYAETMTKAATAFQGKTPPDVAALSSTELHTLMDMDAIIPLDDYIAKDGGDKYKKDFYEAFMLNGQVGGKTYSIPFQRSTIVLYYNKDAFKEAGLDPEKAPKNYAELLDYAKKLTKDGRWGIELPSTAFTHWVFQAFALQNGKNVMNQEGTKVFFDTPENVKALEYWVSLAKTHKVMPEGTIEWGTIPSDFISGKTAMMYHTTGNLTRVKNEAKFNFGTAFLPAGEKGFGTPVGGGNLYIFKGISKEKQDAAWKFIKWMTEPSRMGQFSIDTGYVAPMKSAYETEVLKKYVAGFPQAIVARDQLQYASASISTHNNGQVQKIFEDNLQAAITGKATPAEALKKAQAEAEKVLAPFNKN